MALSLSSRYWSWENQSGEWLNNLHIVQSWDSNRLHPAQLRFRALGNLTSESTLLTATLYCLNRVEMHLRGHTQPYNSQAILTKSKTLHTFRLHGFMIFIVSMRPSVAAITICSFILVHTIQAMVRNKFSFLPLNICTVIIWWGKKTKPCNIEPTKALTKNNSMTIMFVSLHELNLLNTKNIFQLKNNLRNSEKKNSRNVVKMLNLNSHIQKVSGYYVAMKSIKVKFKILLHFQAIESNLIVI